jgi:hypothetical protein
MIGVPVVVRVPQFEKPCDTRNNKNASGFVQHFLDTGHAYGKIDEIMKIVKIQEKR